MSCHVGSAQVVAWSIWLAALQVQMHSLGFRWCTGLVETEFFQQQFIGLLLDLETDPVPNVRMALARMLAAADLTNLPNAVEVLRRLSKDSDRSETRTIHPHFYSHRLCVIPAMCLNW